MTSFVIYYEEIWLKCGSGKNRLVETLHIEFQSESVNSPLDTWKK